MTNDDMVDEFTALLVEMHARIDALDASPEKDRANRLANVAHGALEALQDVLSGAGVVKPLDGTNKPPPGP